MNRRSFLATAPLIATLPNVIQGRSNRAVWVNYYFVVSHHWDENQRLQNAIVSDYDLSTVRFKSIQNASDNIYNHNQRYFEAYPSDESIEYRIWYFWQGENYLVGEITLGVNGRNTFTHQWTMTDEQIRQLEQQKSVSYLTSGG